MRTGGRMRVALNLLAGVLVLLLLLLRKRFAAAIADLPHPDPKHRRRIVPLLALAAVAGLAFVVVGLWALVEGGYPVVALAVVVFVVLQLGRR